MKSTTDTKVEIGIPFGGFYESVHDHYLTDVLEREVEYAVEDGKIDFDEGHDMVWDLDIDWGEVHQGYSKLYVEEFQDQVLPDIELEGIKLEFKELTSPQYYNFSTDKIWALVSEEDARRIYDAAKDCPNVSEYIKERFTPRSGFSPYYSRHFEDEDWNFENLAEVQYRVLLEMLIDYHIDRDWEIYLMEDANGNGYLDEILADGLNEFHKKLEEVQGA